MENHRSKNLGIFDHRSDRAHYNHRSNVPTTESTLSKQPLGDNSDSSNGFLEDTEKGRGLTIRG